jgi:hypothetical protein
MSPPQLLSALVAAGCSPSVDNGELLLDDPPDELVPMVEVYLIPLIALLTGRQYIAIDSQGRGCVLKPGERIGDGITDPTLPIPINAYLMYVPGVTGWEYSKTHLRHEYPELFREAGQKTLAQRR